MTGPIDGSTGYSFFSQDVKGDDLVLVTVSNFTFHQQGATSLSDNDADTTIITQDGEHARNGHRKFLYIYSMLVIFLTRRKYSELKKLFIHFFFAIMNIIMNKII